MILPDLPQLGRDPSHLRFGTSRLGFMAEMSVEKRTRFLMSVHLFTSSIRDSSVYLVSSFRPADRSDGGRGPGLDFLVVLVLAREDPDMAELVGDRLSHPGS